MGNGSFCRWRRGEYGFCFLPGHNWSYWCWPWLVSAYTSFFSLYIIFLMYFLLILVQYKFHYSNRRTQLFSWRRFVLWTLWCFCIKYLISLWLWQQSTCKILLDFSSDIFLSCENLGFASGYLMRYVSLSWECVTFWAISDTLQTSIVVIMNFSRCMQTALFI